MFKAAFDARKYNSYFLEAHFPNNSNIEIAAEKVRSPSEQFEFYKMIIDQKFDNCRLQEN